MAGNEEALWTEDRLRGLDPDEHDFQEFKSSLYVLNHRQEQAGDFLVGISKQVSAFANAAVPEICMAAQRPNWEHALVTAQGAPR